MSDGIDVSEILSSQVDMSSDPFDDVVEYEPTTESEGQDPFDELDEGNDESKEESSEEPEEEENSADEDEDSEGGEESAEKEDKEAEGEKSEDDAPEVDFAKQIEDGSLEVEIGEEKVTLKDLKNDYIGQKEIARRFTDYDIKSKQLEKDNAEINTYINDFASILKSGDSLGAMAYLGEFAGTPPYMIKEQLIAALAPEIIRREQMTSTELQNEYLSSQNEYLKGQRESELKRQEYSQAQEEARNHVNELRETNGIDEQTWNEASSHLEKTLAEGEQLTPELIADTIKYSRMYAEAESVVDLSGEQLEDREKWVEELVNVKEKYPDFTEEDLKEVLKNAFDTVKKASSEEKLAKKLESKKSSVSKKQTKQTNPASMDTDPELDDWL